MRSRGPCIRLLAGAEADAVCRCLCATRQGQLSMPPLLPRVRPSFVINERPPMPHPPGQARSLSRQCQNAMSGGLGPGQGRKYVGFGSLKVASAKPPVRSLNWSPKSATMS